MNESAVFWDKVAERYAKQPVADRASYQKKLEYTQNLFTQEMQVLELGCDTGTMAIIHAPLVKHIRGIDCSSRMIGIAQSRADAKGVGNVSFECGEIEGLDVPDASVDVVMMHSILHLLEDKETAINRVFRMLRPGGWFVSSTACMNDAMGFMRPVIPLMRYFGMAPDVVKFFTARQLLNSIGDAGFTIDYQWQPSRTEALFVVARKPG